MDPAGGVAERDMENPMVSVIVPTYNGVNDLRDLLDDLLRQTYDNYEILVVDNNSTDGTAEYVRQKMKNAPRIRYFQETGQGKSFAANTGIAEARGGLFAFTDQDCRVPSDWLQSIVDVFQDTGADGVGGVVEIDLQGSPTRLTLLLVRADVLPGAYYRGDTRREVDWLIGDNMCFRRQVFDQVGGFNTAPERYTPTKGYGTEVDLCMRAQRAGLRLMYDPSIRIHHRTPPRRQTLRYTLMTCFWVGAANTVIRRPVNPRAVATLHPLKVIANIFVAAGRLYARVLLALNRESQ